MHNIRSHVSVNPYYNNNNNNLCLAGVELLSDSATFYAGTTMASINVSICDDNEPEENEYFLLSINRTKLPKCISVDHTERRDYSNVTIVNDDTCK